MGSSENSSVMAFGTVHYYANLPGELKPNSQSGLRSLGKGMSASLKTGC